MQARKLNKDERRVLKEYGRNPQCFLMLNKTADDYTYLETISGKVITLRR